jgi:2-keto-3-deoxy-L-rhamnonate aldolase RhmA
MSLDYGYASPSDPALLPLLEKIIGIIHRSGKRCGIHLADLGLAPQMRDLGVTYFTVAPLAMIGPFLQSKSKEIKEMFSGLPGNSQGRHQ